MRVHEALLIEGTGIGHEIAQSAVQILNAAGAKLEFIPVKLPLDEKALRKVEETKLILKGPTVGLDESFFTSLGIHSQIRFCKTYFPSLPTMHPEMDVVVFSGDMESFSPPPQYRQTKESVSLIRTFTREKYERLFREAFSFATLKQRKKMSLFANDHTLKESDGFIREIFEQVAIEYPNILVEVWAANVGAAKLSASPEIFDLIIAPAPYGAMVSDIATLIAGPSGLSSSMMIGDRGTIFTTAQGPHLKSQGKNQANPSALILASCNLLEQVGEKQAAKQVEDAWLKTIEDGFGTTDLAHEGLRALGTQEFTRKVIENLGKSPKELPPSIYYDPLEKISLKRSASFSQRRLVGMDVCFYPKANFHEFFTKVSHINVGFVHLKAIFNQETKIWPGPFPKTALSEHWRFRFLADGERHIVPDDLIKLLHAIDHMQIEILGAEFLFTFPA